MSATTAQVRARILAIAAVNLVALGALTAPAVAGLPLKVAAALPVGERTAALATIVSLGALMSVVANPVFGWLSDRTRGRFGRRRPWIIGGAVAGLGTTVGLALSTDLVAVAAWWMLTQTAYNATLAAAAALLADTVPEQRRASASGVFTAAAFVGALPPLLLVAVLPDDVTGVMLIMPAAALVGAVICGILVPEQAASAGTVPSPLASPSSDAVAPRRWRAFAGVWLQRFATQSAFLLTASFTLYLVADRMTHDAVAATPAASLSTLVGGAGVVVGALLAGALASRRGAALPLIVAATVLLAGAAVVRAVAVTPLMLWVAAILGGSAVGALLAVNLALALRALVPGHAGAALGILNIAETLPGVVMPLVAAALVRLGGPDPFSGGPDNYATLYVCAAVLALTTLGVLPLVRRVARPAVSASPVSEAPVAK